MYKGQSTRDWVSRIWFANEEKNPEIKDVVAIGAPAVPYLIERLRDPRPRIARNKVYAKLWDHSPRWVQQNLPTPHLAEPLPIISDRKSAVVYALGLMGTNAAAAIPALLDAVEDKNNYGPIRASAIGVIRIVGAGPEAIPTMERRLRDDHIRSRQAYFEAFGPHTDGISDTWDLIQRGNAAITLAHITNRCNSAIQPIKALLDVTNVSARVNATVALWRLAPSPELEKQIENGLSDTNHRFGFVSALSKIGKPAQPFLQLLVEIRSKMDITDTNQWAGVTTRTTLDNAIKKITPEE